jgi:hypothetical protein
MLRTGILEPHPTSHREVSLTPAERSSGPTDSLAPPASPYPSQVEPSSVDSNGTESTEIEEDAQEDPELKSPLPEAAPRLKSPDIEISSPQSAGSVRSSQVLQMRVTLLIEINRANLKRLSHNYRLTRDLIRKKTRRSLSSMFLQASRIFARARRVEHSLMRSSHQLHSSLPPLQRQLIAPAKRCVLRDFTRKALLTISSDPPAYHP